MSWDECLVLRGTEIEVPGVEVRNTQHQHGFDLGKVYPTSVHGRFGAGRPNGLCFHDSVTATSAACFHALGTRKNGKGEVMGLGTGLIVDPDGTLYQIVPDLDTVTWHATGWSAFMVGVDVVSLVDPKLAPKSPLRRPPAPWSERQGFLDYTEAQKATLRAFVPALCDALGVPFDCPREPDGRPAVRGYGKGPVRGLDAWKFRGCVGHAQVSKARWDGNVALLSLFSDGQVVA